MYTWIRDMNGDCIRDGDFVVLDSITADDSLGLLPNGFIFEADRDIYKVYFDKRINNWSLDLGVEPDSDYNIKYMNHAVGLLYLGDSVIVENNAK